jgi:hypothetical protein
MRPIVWLKQDILLKWTTSCDSQLENHSMRFNIPMITRTLMYSPREDEIESPEDQGDSLEAPQCTETSIPTTADALQTFVFSATLSKDLQKNLKRLQKNYRKKNFKPASTLGMFAPLIDRTNVTQDLKMTFFCASTFATRIRL